MLHYFSILVSVASETFWGFSRPWPSICVTYILTFFKKDYCIIVWIWLILHTNRKLWYFVFVRMPFLTNTRRSSKFLRRRQDRNCMEEIVWTMRGTECLLLEQGLWGWGNIWLFVEWCKHVCYRTAVEAQLLGARTVLIERRPKFTRNNVLKLWKFLVQDLKSLGAKKFFGKFSIGSINHVNIRTLQVELTTYTWHTI